MSTQDSPTLAMNEQELIKVLTTSLYPGAAIESVKMVLSYCKASGLDPMQKPVHIVPMWDRNAGCMRDVIMPGIGLYRTQAARGGEYAGVTEPEFGPDVTEKVGFLEITYPTYCKVTVLRRLPDGTLANFTAVERWKENYAIKGGKEKDQSPNAMWAKRPYGQLAKCAEAQALRKAFPEIGAQPTAEEMEGKNYEPADIMPQANKPEALPYYPAEDFEKNLPIWHGLISSGKKPAKDVIATVSSKYVLTPEQVKKIQTPPKEPIQGEVVSNDDWGKEYDENNQGAQAQ